VLNTSGKQLKCTTKPESHNKPLIIQITASKSNAKVAAAAAETVAEPTTHGGR